MNNFIETSPPITDLDLRELEEKINVLLPDEFKKHYLLFNGGFPEKDAYTWKDGSTTTINTFSSIKHHGFSSMENIYLDLVVNKEYLPIGIVPFATDDGGNQFCISTRASDYGSIYYCNHDHYNINDKEECLTLIEVKFDDFLSNLDN